MSLRRADRLASAVLLAICVAAPACLAQQQPSSIRLRLDASEAPRKIYHAELTIPAAPGPMDLFYPKWIPGEHAPTGPITDLAGLKISSAGRAIPWKRDPVELFAFHINAPAGAPDRGDFGRAGGAGRLSRS